MVIGGGPAAHSGLTGRKTGIDTYGEYARHSGAAGVASSGVATHAPTLLLRRSVPAPIRPHRRRPLLNRVFVFARICSACFNAYDS